VKGNLVLKWPRNATSQPASLTDTFLSASPFAMTDPPFRMRPCSTNIEAAVIFFNWANRLMLSLGEPCVTADH
jgi:hypothetical protein